MRPVPVFLATWTLSGAGALIGSIIGSAAGTFGLFTGAVLGGVLGVAVAAGAVAKLHWLSPEERGGWARGRALAAALDTT